MQIILNGELKNLQDGLNIAALVRELAIDTRQVAVEKNREIIPKSLYRTTGILDGDEVEIVSFIGGG